MARIDRIIEILDRTRASLLSEVAGLDARQFAWRPSPSEWSAAHVLEHLALVESKATDVFRAMLEGSAGPPIRLIDRLRRMPPWMVAYRFVKVKNEPPMTPGDPRSKDELLQRLAQSREQLKELMEQARGRDLSRMRRTHFACGALNLYDWFALVGYHEERHRKQIAGIKKRMPGV